MAQFTPTYAYTGGNQTFVVPTGVAQITVACYGARGGPRSTGLGGLGGLVACTLVVVPGETLRVVVGGEGVALGTPGGFNGGGLGNSFASQGGSGGGASDIRRTPYALADRLIVAGGGGGGGGFSPGFVAGGAGGYPTGAAGVPNTSPGGGGGTQIAGGAAGGASATPGALGQGGNGHSSAVNGCGGGGGGYYGGGGGADGGGGGGSGYASGTSITNTDGARNGDGLIVITYYDPPLHLAKLSWVAEA